MLPGKYPVVIDVAISHDSYTGEMDREKLEEKPGCERAIGQDLGSEDNNDPRRLQSSLGLWCPNRRSRTSRSHKQYCSANIC